ncbi:MAG: cupredoxin domain-containing protein [Gemmatimonadaceae bacterium]
MNSVSVINNAYQPASLAVAAGAAVTWTWNTCFGDSYGGQSCVSHSVTFDDGTTSLTQQTGRFSRTFAIKGTYKYHCVVHGTAMSGTVTVS